MAKVLNLPSWAKVIDTAKIEMDAGKFYPEILEDFGVKELDQYWLEVAFQCAKLDVQLAVSGTEHQAPTGGALCLIVVDEGKQYAQSKYPEGKGADQAGKDAKSLWKKLRGLDI